MKTSHQQQEPSRDNRCEHQGVPDLARSSFDGLGRKIAIGLASLAVGVGATGITGCSPQQSSYWSGTNTKLPAPPPEARVQLGISSEQDGTIFVSFVVWDASAREFQRRDIHYTTTTLGPSTFKEAGGYVQSIPDGHALVGGMVVDQASGVILLPGGSRIDGPSGNLLGANGQILKQAGH